MWASGRVVTRALIAELWESIGEQRYGAREDARAETAYRNAQYMDDADMLHKRINSFR